MDTGNRTYFKESLLEMIEKNFNNNLASPSFVRMTESAEVSKLMQVRRVTITPSGIELSFPSQWMSNRAIRSHYNYIDNFLRVRFLNEDGQRGAYWGGTNSEDILKYMESILKDGFGILRWKLKFLHYSNSQVLSHSWWFIHEIRPHFYYDKFILSLGDFSKEKSNFKGIARRGQAFSSAISTAKI